RHQERRADRLDDLPGGRHPALLQPGVPGDAHPGQRGDLLAAQPRRPAPASPVQPDVGRGHLGPGRPQVRAQVPARRRPLLGAHGADPMSPGHTMNAGLPTGGRPREALPMTESPAPEMWRVRTDSSDLAEPRVLIRAFLEPGRLDPGIAFYERLPGGTADARSSYPEAGLRLAVVGAFLLIEGDRAAVAPGAAPAPAPAGTRVAADVHPTHDRLGAERGESTDPPKKVPTGTGFSARHPDGTVVEYVHHGPTADRR